MTDDNMDGDATILLFILEWAVVPLVLAVIEAFRRIFRLEKNEDLIVQSVAASEKLAETITSAQDKRTDDILKVLKTNNDQVAHRLASIEEALRKHG